MMSLEGILVADKPDSDEAIYKDVVAKITEQVARLKHTAKGNEMSWFLVAREDDFGMTVVRHNTTVDMLTRISREIANSPPTPDGGQVYSGRKH